MLPLHRNHSIDLPGFYIRATSPLNGLNRCSENILRAINGPNPVGIYLLKVNNRDTKTRCEICSKLTIKTPERRHLYRSGVFIVNFEHIFTPCPIFFSVVNFEQVITDWVE